jgi:hypothetical protein
MIKKISLYICLTFCVISFNAKVFSQTLGFGCLGFVGGYGGIVYQKYNAEGLNNFVKYFNETETLNGPMEEFYGAVGYRVGINFFRATLESGIIFSAKGYYQSLSRSREASGTLADGSNGSANYTSELDLKNWGIGFDVGYSFSSYFSWKIVDGAINFNNVTLTNTVDSPGNSDVTKYKSDSGVIGYTVGTGIIVSIVKDYVSLEGLAGYTHLQIEDLQTDDGSSFMESVPGNGNFIEAGGFTALLQVNVGFPL